MISVENLKKGELVYEGKGKRAYSVIEVPDRKHPEWLWLEYKDSLTAFNAQKKGDFAGKGRVNKGVSALVYQYLREKGLRTHLVAEVSEHEIICQRLEMIPLEVVVRNRLAGSTAKKFQRPEGESLTRPLVEFYYKDDALEDPFVSDEQALMLGTVQRQGELNLLKLEALKVNELLGPFFAEVGLELIDFKLEFGWLGKERSFVVLGDEISPDSCRLWDMETGERMDKDRFRRDLGKVEESYNEVLNRLRSRWEKRQ